MNFVTSFLCFSINKQNDYNFKDSFMTRDKMNHVKEHDIIYTYILLKWSLKSI